MGKAVRQKELTPKQRRFALEYLVDLNATQAAIRAGYSKHTAYSIGSENLKKPEIAALMNEALGKREKGAVLNRQEVEEHLARLLRFDPAKAFDAEGRLLPLPQMPEDVRRCIAGFEEEALFDMVPTGETGPRGGVVKERIQVGVTRKVKWVSPGEAATLGARRFGLLKDRVDHGGSVAIPTREITDKEWEQLAKLEHEVRGAD